MSRWARAAGPGAALIAALAVAAWIYRPWVVLPFDIWDFREFVPLLRRSEGVVDQLAGLARYYADHGRQNLLFYSTFVAQWQWFGDSPAGWQLVRFGLMMGNVVLAFLVLRRFGISRFGALAGAGMLLAATPVLRGWVQLMAEPQALMALLLATLIALRYQGTVRWKRDAALLALLLAVVVFSKEVLGVLAGLVVLLAWCRQPDGSFRVPGKSPRNRLLAGLSLLVVFGAGILLLVIRSRPSAQGYGMAYGEASFTLARVGDLFLAAILPFRTAGDFRVGLLYPANLLFLAIAGLGWAVRLRERGTRRSALIELGWIGAIPLVGALAYWPWPKYDSFYALPFFFGSALLLGCAVTALERRSRSYRIGVRIAVPIAIGYLAIAAQRSVAVASAALELNVALARNLKVFREADTVMVAGPRIGHRALPVQGPELGEYAVAMGYARSDELPRVVDVDCEGGRQRLAAGLGRKVLVSYSYGCGVFPESSVRLTRSYRYRDWLTLRPVIDSAMVDFLVPAR